MQKNKSYLPLHIDVGRGGRPLLCKGLDGGVELLLADITPGSREVAEYCHGNALIVVVGGCGHGEGGG